MTCVMHRFGVHKQGYLGIALSHLHLPENDRSVRATEAEGIGNRNVDLHVAGDIRNIVKIALGILIEDVDRGWSNLVTYGQGGKYRFDPASSPQQVTGHGFGRADCNLLGIVAEETLDRLRFGHVASRRRSAMRINVIDLIRVDSRIA